MMKDEWGEQYGRQTPPSLRDVGADSYALCLYQLYSIPRLHPRGIRFGYSGLSVRPQTACIIRVGSLGFGNFASKSEWTFATIPLQCNNFALRSGGTPARRASNTPSAFLQDSYVAFSVSGVGLGVTERHAPPEVGRGGYIPPSAYPGPIHPTVPESNHKGCPVLSHE